MPFWYHQLYRGKGSHLLAIPAEVVREWHKRGAVYVRIQQVGPNLLLEPLTEHMKPAYPPSPVPAEPSERRDAP